MADKKTKAKPKKARRTRKLRNDQTNWRRQLADKRVKFDDRQKGVYIELLTKYGRMGRAAVGAGVCNKTVAAHRDNDPDFDEMVVDAIQSYNDTIADEVRRRGAEGWEEPIFHKGQRSLEPILDEDGAHSTNANGDPLYRYTTVRKFSDRLLELEAKRSDPTYRDKAGVEVNTGGGGVLLAPAGVTPEEAIAEGKRLNEESDKRHAAEEEERTKKEGR